MTSTCQDGEVGFTTALPPIGEQVGQFTYLLINQLLQVSNEKFCEMDKVHTVNETMFISLPDTHYVRLPRSRKVGEHCALSSAVQCIIARQSLSCRPAGC
jgi:hypothetical protein